MRDTVLYFVVPCYNEEEVLLETAKQLYKKYNQLLKAKKIAPESRILFVNDGSADGTWGIIERLHQWNPMFSGLSLSRNRGHQNALLAGLMVAKDYCDVSISMDADLQDDIDAVDEMLSRFEGGAEIVYGVRNNRQSDSIFKRVTARLYYKILSRMGADIIYDHADYRLMSRRAMNGLSEFKEVNLFLRGLVPMIGFKSEKVYYDRAPRTAGKSKYPLGKMIRFALEGVTSLTTAPIKMITNLGVLLFITSIVFLIWGIVQKLRGVTVQGWSSLIVSIWAIGGLILLSIGIIGEYIAKIYLETKARPRFLIDEFINDGTKRRTIDFDEQAEGKNSAESSETEKTE